MSFREVHFDPFCPCDLSHAYPFARIRMKGMSRSRLSDQNLEMQACSEETTVEKEVHLRISNLVPVGLFLHYPGELLFPSVNSLGGCQSVFPGTYWKSSMINTTSRHINPACLLLLGLRRAMKLKQCAVCRYQFILLPDIACHLKRFPEKDGRDEAQIRQRIFIPKR